MGFGGVLGFREKGTHTKPFTHILCYPKHAKPQPYTLSPRPAIPQ